jgi:hypothetical protein
VRSSEWFWVLGRRLGMLTLLFVALALPGCGSTQPRLQAAEADAIALSANSALPLLAEAFRQEGLAAIADVKARGGGEDEAREAVAALEEKWKPVWDAWATLRIAEGALASLLEQGGETASALEQARRAYCALLSHWPESVPKLITAIACGL